jgi:hypothetical protein
LVLTIFWGLGGYAQTFSGGSGSQGDPYKISTPADLVELSTITNVNDGIATVGKYFVMTNSIDMEGVKDFKPIGITTQDWDMHYFCGNFDGKGFAIKNLSIIDTVSNSHQVTVLFGNVKGAKILNLILDNASFTYTKSGSTILAAFVGDAYDSLYMDNCIAINCTLNGGEISGFMNMLSGVSCVNNCHVINAKAEGNDISGFCRSLANPTAQITNSSVRHSTFTSRGNSRIIAGFASSIAYSKISKCCVYNCNLSSVSIAGFVYMVGNGEIDNCGVTATFSRTNASSFSSGFAWWYGGLGSTVLTSNSYAACEFTNTDSVDVAFGGVAGQGTSIVTNCYGKTDPKLNFVLNNHPSVVEKSESDLKAAGMVGHPGSLDNSLNYGQSTAAWKQDFNPYPINRGYPILGWMQPFFYVSTYPVTGLSKTTATLQGLTFAEGEGIITEHGFQWREKGTGSWTKVVITDTAFNISHPLTGLTKNTTYEYFAYMHTVTQPIMHGDTVEFTTSISASTVITLPATNIAETSSTLNGQVNEDLDEPVVERGFEWRKIGTTTWNPVLATGTSNISYPLTGLTGKTQYEFRAYIKTTLTKYGETLNFTTKDGTGVAEIVQGANINVYPNPTNGHLIIERRELKIENIEIYNVVGQLLQSTTANQQSEISIDVSHLQSGLYFLKIDNRIIKFDKE